MSREFLKRLQALGRKIGIKILQRTVMKYVLPIVSIGIGATWNYLATKTEPPRVRRRLS